MTNLKTPKAINMQDCANLFPDNFKVFPIRNSDAFINTNDYGNISSCEYFLHGENTTLVNEVSNFLKHKPADTVYSFFCRKEGQQQSWQLCSCRLNKNGKEPINELVVFIYDLDFRDDLKKRLQAVLEQHSFFKSNFEKVSKLTKKEKEISQLLTQGMSSKEIALNNFTSVHTVNTHRKNISKKLGIQNIAGLQQFSELFDMNHHKNIL